MLKRSTSAALVAAIGLSAPLLGGAPALAASTDSAAHGEAYQLSGSMLQSVVNSGLYKNSIQASIETPLGAAAEEESFVSRLPLSNEELETVEFAAGGSLTVDLSETGEPRSFAEANSAPRSSSASGDLNAEGALSTVESEETPGATLLDLTGLMNEDFRRRITEATVAVDNPSAVADLNGIDQVERDYFVDGVTFTLTSEILKDFYSELVNEPYLSPGQADRASAEQAYAEALSAELLKRLQAEEPLLSSHTTQNDLLTPGDLNPAEEVLSENQILGSEALVQIDLTTGAVTVNAGGVLESLDKDLNQLPVDTELLDEEFVAAVNGEVNRLMGELAEELEEAYNTYRKTGEYALRFSYIDSNGESPIYVRVNGVLASLNPADVVFISNIELSISEEDVERLLTEAVAETLTYVDQSFEANRALEAQAGFTEAVFSRVIRSLAVNEQEEADGVYRQTALNLHVNQAQADPGLSYEFPAAPNVISRLAAPAEEIKEPEGEALEELLQIFALPAPSGSANLAFATAIVGPNRLGTEVAPPVVNPPTPPVAPEEPEAPTEPEAPAPAPSTPPTEPEAPAEEPAPVVPTPEEPTIPEESTTPEVPTSPENPGGVGDDGVVEPPVSSDGDGAPVEEENPSVGEAVVELPSGDNVDEVYYENCDQVTELGRAPLYRGDPGYRAGLDRDNDGMACDVTDIDGEESVIEDELFDESPSEVCFEEVPVESAPEESATVFPGINPGVSLPNENEVAAEVEVREVPCDEALAETGAELNSGGYIGAGALLVAGGVMLLALNRTRLKPAAGRHRAS